MKKEKILNYTTKITPEQTISEIQTLLAGYGVSAMMTEYEGRQVSAVSFKMIYKEKTFGFKMPCNWRGVKQVLSSPEYPSHIRDNDEQAIRVAWRILYVWIKAQLALVEVNMVTIPQIFLPYTITSTGQTLAEKLEETPELLLK